MGNLVNTAQTTPAWADLARYRQGALSLRQGRAWLLATSLNHSTRGQEMIGFWPTTTLDDEPNCALYTNANFLRARGGANTGGREVDYDAATDYPVAVVWTQTGYQVFSKRGDDWYRDWHIRQSDLVNYAGLSIYDSVGSIADRFVIRDRNANLFAFDVDLASPAIGDGSYNGGSEAQLPAYEFYMEFDYDVEPTDGYYVFGYQFVTVLGDDTFYFFRIDSSSNLSWGLFSGGEYSDYYDFPDPIPTITPGSTIRIMLDWDGLRIFENGSEVFFYDDVAAYYNVGNDDSLNRDWSILDFGVGGEISNLKIGKRRLRNESGEFGADVIVNGDFDTDTDWTKGTNWTIAAGVANIAHPFPHAETPRLDAAVDPLTIGKLYVATCDAANIDTDPDSILNCMGALPSSYGSFFFTIAPYYGHVDGEFTGKTWARDGKFNFWAQRPCYMDIDNVVVQEVLFAPDELGNILNSMLS